MSQLVAPVFGSGKDGVLAISSNVTDNPIDASCSGSQGSRNLSATNASFAVGQMILIHQSRGTGAGRWEVNKIASYTSGTITTVLPLSYTYTDSGASQAQVLVLKEYSKVTVNSGRTWTAKAWNGNVGGILAFVCNGIVTVSGTISASGKGYRGGGPENPITYQGEGTAGVGSRANKANGNGGGGVADGQPDPGAGGGGHANPGSSGTGSPSTPGGGTAGSADLTTMVFGGGGGGATTVGGSPGGSGGGVVLIFSRMLSVTGSIMANGASAASLGEGGAGGGAGGSILVKSQNCALGNGLLVSAGGNGGSGTQNRGGAGSVGRIRVEYQSLSGTTNPAASTQYYYFGSDHAGMI